LVSTKISTYI
jgi:histone acetyltransferase